MHENANTLSLRDDVIKHAVACDCSQIEFAWSASALPRNIVGATVSIKAGALYSWFAHDVILCHWAPSWLTLQITSAVYSEILVSIYYFIVSFSVL